MFDDDGVSQSSENNATIEACIYCPNYQMYKSVNPILLRTQHVLVGFCCCLQAKTNWFASTQGDVN